MINHWRMMLIHPSGATINNICAVRTAMMSARIPSFGAIIIIIQIIAAVITTSSISTTSIAATLLLGRRAKTGMKVDQYQVSVSTTE